VKGSGEATAAITIVNALAAGVGSAVGIDLRVRAEVDLRPSGSSGKWDVDVPDSARTPLVIHALTEALRRFAPDSSGTGALVLHSDVPIARGLKSSSAVSSAIVLAVARAMDASLDPLEVARLSAHVSRAAGVSATGALDDALAGLTTGVVVTDNRAETVLARYSLPPELGVVLYLPPGKHRPAPELLPAFRAVAEQGQVAGELAKRGQWQAAMRENTTLVERVIGYDYAALRERLRARGAVASGVSGLGPAYATIAPVDSLGVLLAELPDTAGTRRSLAFSPARGAAEEAA
jgi:shikimate kinase